MGGNPPSHQAPGTVALRGHHDMAGNAKTTRKGTRRKSMMVVRQDCGRIGRNGARDEAALAGAGPNADQLRMILWKTGSRRETRRGRRKEARRVFGGGVCQRGLRSESTSQTLFRRPRQRKKRCRRSEAPSRQPPCLLPPRAPCLRRRQRRKESERACPWVGGAYLISIRVWPLFSRCSPIFWGSAPSRDPSHDPSRDPSRKTERYVD